MFSKNFNDSSTVIFNTSAIFLSLKRISRASRLYLAPLHASQVTYTSGKNCISILICPSPSQTSHLPPFTLKENLPGPYPLIFASGESAKRSLTYVKAPVYVAGLERGVLPIGLWSTKTTLSTYSKPSRLL